MARGLSYFDQFSTRVDTRSNEIYVGFIFSQSIKQHFANYQ